MIYIIGDTHFYDSGINALANRPFDSVEKMNQTMVTNWNKTVASEDTIISVGDFACFRGNDGGDKEHRLWLISDLLHRLQGKKILIMGNHDMWLSPEEWRSAGFDEVIQYPIVYNEFYILSHSPLYMNETTPFANIFSHVHSNPMYKTVSSQSYCVSVERTDYSPISFDFIMKKIAGCATHE